MPPVRAEMEDGPGPSSELQELKNMLLRSPGPSKLPPVYKWLPKSMSGSTRELVRGRRTYTYGMLKPVGTMVLPAYLLGAVAAVTGERRLDTI